MEAGGAMVERVDSYNLRDLLRIKDEDHNRITTSTTTTTTRSHVTLQAILSDKRLRPPPSRVQSTRTLLDIIRDDQTPSYGSSSSSSNRNGRSSWRHLKEKILLRRRGSGPNPRWTSTVHTPTSDVPINNNDQLMITRSNSARIEISIRAEEEENEEEREMEEQPARMSLLSLLAETDRQMGVECSAYIMDEDDQEEDEVAVNDNGNGGGGFNSCCVCMVRHKGAAFIPCGHTFCRLCSRELWAQRGNCPLCNNYIREILDIF